MTTAKNDLQKMAAIFEQQIAPVLVGRQILNTYTFSSFASVEKYSDKVTVCSLLDSVAGIDVLGYDSVRGLIGIGARIQSERSYRTFTVRCFRSTDAHGGTDTELLKRINSIRQGGLYPPLTAQIYVNHSTATIGIVRTVELFNMIEQNLWALVFRGSTWHGFVEAIRANDGGKIGKLLIRSTRDLNTLRPIAWFVAVQWVDLLSMGVAVQTFEIPIKAGDVSNG